MKEKKRVKSWAREKGIKKREDKESEKDSELSHMAVESRVLCWVSAGKFQPTPPPQS